MVVWFFILKHLLIALFGVETKWWLRPGSATTKFCHHRLSIALYLKYTCHICQYDQDHIAATHTISSMEVQLDRRMRA